MTIQSSVKDKILATLSETSKYEYEIRYHPGKTNVVIDALRRKERVKPRHVRAMAMTIRYGVRGMMLAAQSKAFKEENGMMRTVVMDEAHASRSPVLWAEIGESSLIGPELVQETTDKVVLIKEKLKAARDRQKSYADNRRKPLEFEVGDRVMLKVSPCKGVVGFGKKGKLAPRCLYAFMWKIGSQSIECDHLNEIGMVLRESSFQNIWPRRFLRSGSHSNVGYEKSCQSSKFGSDLGLVRDYECLCATCYCDMDRGTRSVPLFVVLERDRLKTLMDRESETKTSKSNVHDYQSLVKVVKDKILATLSQTSKVENAPAEMLCKTNVVIDALRRKERVKPRRVRAMAMTIQYGFDWPELVSRTTDKVVLIKEKLKSVRDCQKSYADNRSKPLEFEVGDQVMLKVSPCKGVVGFGKMGS
ncbi:hypothetical protein Tco_0787675 [Tanacetum coccineum]